MEKARNKTHSTVKKEEIPTGSSRLNVKIVADLFLIYLVENMNDSSAYYHSCMSQLSQVANMFKVYTDRDHSFDFLTDIQHEDICLLISEDICQQVVPLIHDFGQLQHIFIVRKNQKIDEQWTKNWSKIKGIYTDISTICDVIRQTPKKCEQNAVSFNLLNTNDTLSVKKLNQLDPLFMYSQLLTETILEIQFKEENFMEFVDYCRQISSNNDAELKNIQKFQQNYHTKTPIEWYTSERFLYTTLNRGLRTVDADTIIKMGCFIVDLSRQIEQFHRNQYPKGVISDHFTVYRGQVISKVDFEQIKNTIGGLIAFNNFLSTSRNRTISSIFAGIDEIGSELLSISFVITVDPAKSSAGFASIKDISQFPEEDEILFVMHAVFRIVNIKPMSGDSRHFEVELVLTNEADQDLIILQNHIREEIPSFYTGWERLGAVLLQMGMADKSQRIYETQLVGESDKYGRVLIYNQLGTTCSKQGKYDEAINYYNKALVTQQEILPSNHPDIAYSHANIGNVYSNMSDYSKALLFHEKALAIQQQALSSNHPHLADCFNNIGALCSHIGDYSKAFLSHKKALSIQKQSLPSNHPRLAYTYGSMGNLFVRMNYYSEALTSFEQALAIQKQSLLSNHPDLAILYNNIASVYSSIDDYSKARSFIERAMEVVQHSLPPEHPFVQMLQKKLEMFDTINMYECLLISLMK